MKAIEWKDAANTSWKWKPTHINVVVTSVEGVAFDADLPYQSETFIRFHLDSVKNHFLRTNPKERKTWPSGSYREDTWTIAEIEIPENISTKEEQNIIITLITKRKNEAKKWYKFWKKDFVENGKYILHILSLSLSLLKYPINFRTVDLLNLIIFTQFQRLVR